MHKDLRKLAKCCAKWRIKLNHEETKVIAFSKSSIRRNSEPSLKLYGKKSKIYRQVKFLGMILDSKFTFQKYFEGFSLDHNNIDMIISKIQWLQKFIWLALLLPKYKLQHDSSCLPYVENRLLSCETKKLDRISKNPLIEESTFNRFNLVWDLLPTRSL